MTASAITQSPARNGSWPALLAWLVVFAIALLCLAARTTFPWLTTFPQQWSLPIADGVNAVSDAAVPVLRPAFRTLSALLNVPMRAVRGFLEWLPWPATMLAAVALSLKSGGVRLAVFCALALGYILIAGYWPQSMNTLSLVLLAVPLSALLGFALGAAGYRFRAVRQALLALLDLMQTVPSFAYLIPLLLLFGFGPVVGLIASAIYATPPMVRNTMLGLDRVPDSIREAGMMSGCTRRQQFWHVEVPTALPQILVGFNQTTMAALSMVIIAAIIGGFEDIGWEVLAAMRKAEFGQGILSGLVIALLAILIDRLTLGFANKSSAGRTRATPWMTGRRLAVALCLAIVLALILRLTLAERALLPGSGLVGRASVVNQWLLGIVRDYS